MAFKGLLGDEMCSLVFDAWGLVHSSSVINDSWHGHVRGARRRVQEPHAVSTNLYPKSKKIAHKTTLQE